MRTIPHDPSANGARSRTSSSRSLCSSVFTQNPRDTTTTQEFLRAEDLTGKRVMEIGTGSGLLACALKASRAGCNPTDVNPHVSTRTTTPSAWGCGSAGRPPRSPRKHASAFVALRPGETFDLIVSNPPWEDARG
ncbi:MAG: hypothetical protein R2748_11390 [Bryobacterales bacterium]